LDVTVVEKERSEYAVETRVALLVLEFVKVVVHGVGYLELLRHVYSLFTLALKSTGSSLWVTSKNTFD
jgi:hypothetical protein